MGLRNFWLKAQAEHVIKKSRHYEDYSRIVGLAKQRIIQYPSQNSLILVFDKNVKDGIYNKFVEFKELFEAATDICIDIHSSDRNTISLKISLDKPVDKDITESFVEV